MFFRLLIYFNILFLFASHHRNKQNHLKSQEIVEIYLNENK